MASKWYTWGGRIVLVGVLACLAAWSSMATPALAVSNGRTVNASTGAASVLGIDDGGVVSSSDVTRTLAKDSGANWERIALYWSALEPTQGNYNFTSADNTLAPLLDKGFSMVVYLTHNPTWAANTLCGPVDTNNASLLASYGAIYGKLAERYPGVKIWASYNEVDYDGSAGNDTGGCFGARTGGGVNSNGVEDYKEYAKMMAAAWDAVHAANPNAQFASGAIAYDNFNVATAPSGYPGGGLGGIFNYSFPSDLFGYMAAHPVADGHKYMDLLLFNYYDIYGPFWQKKAKGIGIQAKTLVLRKLMKAKGFTTVPLFVSESGTSSLKVGLQGQARCLTLTMVRGASAKLTGVIWWTFRDFLDSAPAPQNTWKYGIVDQDLNPKAAYTALQTLASELDGVTFKKNLTNKADFPGVEAYSFVGTGVLKYVVWSAVSPSPDTSMPECSWTRAVKRATFQADTLRTVTFSGTVKSIKDNSKKDKNPATGVIGIDVGTDPLLVQVNP